MNKILKSTIAVVIITTAFLVCFQEEIIREKSEKDINMSIDTDKKISDKNEESYLLHKKINLLLNGNTQFINIIEVDMKSDRYNISPILSHDSIFGFETTSSMAKRNNVEVAVNGGFYYPYGQPSGIIIINSEMYCSPKSEGERIMFMQKNNNEIVIDEVEFEYLIVSNKVNFEIDGINREPIGNEIVLFTKKYGITNRVNGKTHYNVFLKENQISGESTTFKEDVIPKGLGMLTATGNKISILKDYYINNQRIVTEFIYKSKPEVGEIFNAFEGGFWVVKDNKSVIKERENWVGLTTNREPRTAVGINNKGKVLFVTVDGRQPGHSIGFTGEELAQYLIMNGIKDAIMLDGGASSTLVINDQIANKPSDNGQERMIGGAIGIIKKHVQN